VDHSCVILLSVCVCVFSFVRFTSPESREKALQEANVNGVTFNGSKLCVRMPR